MTKIVDIYNYIDSFAPFDTAMDFDNVGILVGDKNAEPTRAIVTLDITDEVVAEAKKICTAYYQPPPCYIQSA